MNVQIFSQSVVSHARLCALKRSFAERAADTRADLVVDGSWLIPSHNLFSEKVSQVGISYADASYDRRGKPMLSHGVPAIYFELESAAVDEQILCLLTEAAIMAAWNALVGLRPFQEAGGTYDPVDPGGERLFTRDFMPLKREPVTHCVATLQDPGDDAHLFGDVTIFSRTKRLATARYAIPA